MPVFNIPSLVVFGRQGAARLVAIVLCVAPLLACTTAKVTSTWVDETRVGQRIDDVVVVAVSENMVVRRKFEDTFVKELRAAGVEAASSAAVVPSAEPPSQAVLEPELKKLGTKNVLVTHLEGVEQETTYTPPTAYATTTRRSRFRTYYGEVYTNVYRPGYLDVYKTYRVVTRLYDVATEQPIWAIESEVLEPEIVDTAIDALVETAMEDLRKQGLVKSK